MKQRLLHIILVLGVFATTVAQNDYRTFKLDVGLMFGELNEHHVGLFAPYIEPKINITNNITMGLRMEYVFYSTEDFIAFDPNDPYFSGFNADGWTYSSVFTCDYYFNDHYLRPFVGIGAGIFYLYNAKENAYLDFNEEVLAFGYVPRFGVNVGQFRFSCEYNFILSDKTELGYLAFKLGYEIGGKKKWF